MSDSQGHGDHDILSDILKMTSITLIFMGKIIMYYASTIPIFAIASTFQEYKIWKTTPEPLTAYGILKVFLYNIIWMVGCLIGALSLVPIWLQRGLGTTVQLEANAVIEKLVALLCQNALIGDVKIVNENNMPTVKLLNPDAPAPVFIANHCSQLDISSVYNVVRRFKWIAKESVRYIPGPGNLMSLGGHVFIQRTGKNSNSISNLYQQSNDAVQSGIPMMLFPQGTRRMTTKLPFKDGAFKIAIENESDLVPISINIPLNIWNNHYPLNLLWGAKQREEDKIIMTIHEPIKVKKDTDRKELKERCEKIIYSVLPPLYHGKGDNQKEK